MKWHRIIDQNLSSGYVYVSVTDPIYRVFQPWRTRETTIYRVEYQLLTGWWPAGAWRTLREAKACAADHLAQAHARIGHASVMSGRSSRRD